MTNYEKITSMGVTKMSRSLMLLVAETGGEFPCKMICNGGCKAYSNQECIDIIREWLEKEAEK